MNYLQRFMESQLDPYYVPISGIDFYKDDLAKLDSMEVLTIDQFCQPLGLIFRSEFYSSHAYGKMTIQSHQSEDLLQIFKFKDEWFKAKFVNLHHQGDSDQTLYYRCDQLDGVRELIKDKFIL